MAPLVFLAAVVIAILSPFVHLVAAIVDLVVDRRRWRITRLVGMGLAFSVGEVFGLFALFTVWIGSGFGLFMHRPLWVKANNTLASQYLAMVTNAMSFFIGYKFTLTWDQEVEGAQLVFARHAGPGDALQIMKVVFRDMGRRCHAIGAAKLQWDPFLDIAGERLGFHFLLQNPEDTKAELDKIRRLTASLGDVDTLIIYPEGANFTPGRRQQRIDRESSAQREDRAELARSLKHTLLPKTGGALAALDGASGVTVTFLGHAGLDDIYGLDTLWDLMPLHRQVIAEGWTVSPDDIPDDWDGRSEWLFAEWRRMDEWIGETLSA